MKTNDIPARGRDPEPPKLDSSLRTCGICRLEIAKGAGGHITKDHCIRDARQRIDFLRQITLNQAKELDWERTAIKATHRVAYIILDHFTPKKLWKKKKNAGRVTLPRAAFEKVAEGAGVTIIELENGDFEIVAVLPAPPKEEKKPS